MNNSAKLLLLDVLRLRAAYNDKDFEIVASALRAREQNELVASVLELVRDVTELSGSRPKPKRNTGPSESYLKQQLQRIKEVDELRYAALTQIRNVVESKSAFPTVRDIQHVASARTTIPTGKVSRGQVVSAYVASLLDVPLLELEKELQVLRDRSAKEDAEIEGALRMANKIVEAHRK